MIRCAGDRAHGLRVRALIVVLWRAGLRISEALASRKRVPVYWNDYMRHVQRVGLE